MLEYDKFLPLICIETEFMVQYCWSWRKNPCYNCVILQEFNTFAGNKCFSLFKNNDIQAVSVWFKRIWHNLSEGFVIFVSSISILSKKYKQLKFILLHHNSIISFIYTDLCPVSILSKLYAYESRPQEEIVC